MCKMYLDTHKSNRPDVRRVVHLAILGVASAIFASTGLMGYFMFGDHVKGDVLQGFAPRISVQVARGAFAITALCKYPLNMLPLIVSVESRLEPLGVALPHSLITALLSLGVFGTASLGCDLSGIMALLGCTIDTVLGFVMPCLMRMRLNALDTAGALAVPLHTEVAEPPLAPCGKRSARTIMILAGAYCPLAFTSLMMSGLRSSGLSQY